MTKKELKDIYKLAQKYKFDDFVQFMNISQKQDPRNTVSEDAGMFMITEDGPDNIEPEIPMKEKYPVIAIDDIDAETVKRWYQYLVGKNESDMKHDIHAMARASHLNRHLIWEDAQFTTQRQVTDEEIDKWADNLATNKDSYETTGKPHTGYNIAFAEGLKRGAKWMRDNKIGKP